MSIFVDSDIKHIKQKLRILRSLEGSKVPYDIIAEKGRSKGIPMTFSEGEFKDIPFMIQECYCINDKCVCRDADLYLFNAKEQKENKLIYFRVNLDKDNITFDEEYPITENGKNFVNEFMKIFYPVYKKTYLEHYAQAKIFGIELYNLVNAMNEWHEKAKVLYLDVFSDELCWGCTYQDKTYAVLDMYCPNQDCKCTDVTMLFHIKKPGSNRTKEVFAIEVEANLNYHRAQDSDYYPGLDEVVKHFLSSIPDLGKVLAFRSKRIKKFGVSMSDEKVNKTDIQKGLKLFSEYLEKEYKVPELSNVKVGRNALCPCGSGKKFKKCCGA